jgi:hypothetical protein
MPDSRWQKILIGVAALGLVLAAARFDGQIAINAPLSPLPLFSSSPPPTPALTEQVYLPFIIKGLNPARWWMHTSPHQTHLPNVVRGYSFPTPTPTVRAVERPTPTPAWPPALSQPGRSKLGLHVIQNNSPAIMEYIRRTKPAVIKGLGGFGWSTEVKKVSPHTVTVGRLLEDADEGIMTGDPEEAARNFVARHVAEYLLNADVDYWEGWNEPLPGPRMAWYARFEAERTRRMAEHGLRAAIGGFATGTPEWDEFADFFPAIEVALAHGGILTLHEYAAPTLDYRFGEAMPGHPAYPDRGLLLLRYRWWYEDFLKPRGLAIPLVISEGGIDGQVQQDLAPPGLGWRDFAKYWARQGMGKDGALAYVQQLAWYDRQLQQDDYVIGAAIFTAGSPRGHWPSFDITAILPSLADHVVSQQ